jgi:hypothetical protein
MTEPRAEAPRRPYAEPRLKVYGALRDLTLMSVNLTINKNDATQGQNNLKT